MPVTRTDVKEALQQVKANELSPNFSKPVARLRQAEIEGERLARDRLAPEGQACRRWTVTLASAEQVRRIIQAGLLEWHRRQT